MDDYKDSPSIAAAVAAELAKNPPVVVDAVEPESQESDQSDDPVI